MNSSTVRPSYRWKSPKKPTRKPPKKRRKKGSKLPFGLTTKQLIWGILGLVAAGSLFLLILFVWATHDLPDPNALTSRDVEQTTKIYDRTGETLLYEIHGSKNRTLVSLEEIPDVVEWATIATEDQQFYKHSGFNPFRIVYGVVVGSLFKGRAQGGSTITQQLVKNAILTNERTVIRKIKELVISIALERQYSKDEILQLYLNEIPYGSTNYGVEAASQSYFGKSVTEITLAEAATLAALPKAPTRYLNNPDELDLRRDTILQLMANEEYITQEEADAAKDVEVQILSSVENIKAPHFVLYVKEQLVEEFGEREVEQGGYRVITTLDYEKQEIAEEAVLNGVEDRGDLYGFENAALIAMDPTNGHIVSMVGSKDYFSEEIDGAVNVTTRLRQPGSSFKPLVYAAGFARGYTPNTILYDALTAFPTDTGTYSPNNYDLSERGPVTVRKALQGSLNIPAVKMLYLVGVQPMLDFAETLGYTSFEDRSRFGLALVLGGGEVQLLEHTAAYGAFANDGVKHETISILSIEDALGEMLFEWEESEGERVIEENVARMTTNVLKDDAARAYAFGTGGNLTLPGRSASAKTGTTNDYRDAWTLGYTPSLVAGVWAGNNDNSEMNRGAGGSTAAAPIWNSFMRSALASVPAEAFPAAAIPITGKNVIDGIVETEAVVIDRASGKLATSRTPDNYREELICGDFHNILHYVNRSEPLGNAPPNPERADSHYNAWEAGVLRWIDAENASEDSEGSITQCDVPTEEDDVHTAANKPDIEIESPDNKEDIESRTLEVEIDASAPRGISRIEYYIDNVLVYVSSDEDEATFTLPSWVEVDRYKLKAVAFDDVDNSASDEIAIDVEVFAEKDAATIIDPLPSQSIDTTDTLAAYAVIVEVADADDLDALTVYAQNTVSNETQLIGSVSSTNSPYITISWADIEDGEYILYAELESDGDLSTSSFVKVVVNTNTESSGVFDLGADADPSEE